MRCIRRLFSAGILVFVFFVLGATLTPSISSAEDVWVYSRDNFEYYLSTETIKNTNKHPPYTCTVKKIYNGKYDNFDILGFANENDIIIGYSFWRSHGTWDCIGKVSNDPYFSAVWQAMKPYLKN